MKFIISIFICLVCLFIFSLCKVAGDADRDIDKMMDELENEIYEDMK